MPSGAVQMVSSVEPASFRQIESVDGVILLSTPAALQLGICCLKNTMPGQNSDFVKGSQYIRDRKRIVKSILKGKGSVGNDTPISFSHGKDWCEELPQREFDPDKARFHFKKSGIEDTCLLAQANCAKIGFDLQLRKVPNDGY
jgi:peptide/nickel transport system substrate-binding protein